MVRINEPGTAINCQGWRVISSRFDLEGADAVVRAVAPHFLHRRLPQPFAAISGLDKEIVNNTDETAKRHTVAKGHHDVSDVSAIGLDEPDVPSPFVLQQRGKRIDRSTRVQGVWRVRVEFGHHCD